MEKSISWSEMKTLNGRAQRTTVRFFIPDRYLLCTLSSKTSLASQYYRGEAIVIYLRVGQLTLAVCGKKGLARPSHMERG